MKRKKYIFGALFLLLAIAVGCYLFPVPRFEMEQKLYQAFADDESITTQAAVDGVLSEFPVINRADLPADFLLRTEINKLKFRKLSPEKFFVIRKKDLYRKVAGHLRIRHLFAVDQQDRAGFYFSQQPLFWGIDPEILYKVVELRIGLEAQGYHPEAFRCNYGYRHPVLNEAVGGASLSRHIAGDALDLVIDDIDRNGKINAVDKAVVLKLCEQQIIGDLGGIGRYPGTQVVHIDLRGKPARWDDY